MGGRRRAEYSGGITKLIEGGDSRREPPFLAQVLSLERKCYFRPSTWVHHLLTIKGYDDFKRKVRGARSLVGYWRSKRSKMRNMKNEN
jgi:hypothetical protein